MFSIHLAFQSAVGLEIKTYTHTDIQTPSGWSEMRGGEINLLEYLETRQICKSYNTKPATTSTAMVLQVEKKPPCKFHFKTCLAIAFTEHVNNSAKQLQLSHHSRLADASLPPPAPLLYPLRGKQKDQYILPRLSNMLQIFRLINSIR